MASPAQPTPPAAPAPPPRSGEPFEPAGVSFDAISPRLVVARLVGVVVLAVLGVIAAVVLRLVTGEPATLWVAVPGVVLLVVAVVVVPTQVRAWGYAEQDDDLIVRRGVLFRSLTVVPYGRMQYVDVTAGPVDRLLGLATVRLHTASAATDASVPGLTATAAARLRDRLTAAGQARLAGL